MSGLVFNRVYRMDKDRRDKGGRWGGGGRLDERQEYRAANVVGVRPVRNSVLPQHPRSPENSWVGS